MELKKGDKLICIDDGSRGFRISELNEEYLYTFDRYNVFRNDIIYIQELGRAFERHLFKKLDELKHIKIKNIPKEKL